MALLAQERRGRAMTAVKAVTVTAAALVAAVVALAVRDV